MPRLPKASLLTLLATPLLYSCQPITQQHPDSTNIDYQITTTTQIIQTSEAGDKLTKKPNVTFKKGRPSGTTILIRPDIVKQTMTGIGSSITESSAFVLAHLEPQARKEVMNKIFAEEGANFSMTRVPIASTDFSVVGKFSYASVSDDKNLEHFTIAPDKDGFATSDYPGIKDTGFDLLPMIKEAMAIKRAQSDKDFRIIASAWTAPPWMKDIDQWYISGSPENNYQGTGGSLKPEYVQTYADYLIRYLDEYKKEGVNIWGLTPVNEPHGNSGSWESMHFTPATQNVFIKQHLGPALHASDQGDVQVLIYDQNRDDLEHWADEIYGDPQTADFVHGAAVHWYSSTYKVHEDILDRVHEKYPNYSIIHTEGTIDDLGKDAPNGILDPVLFKESGWFDNDAFWWNKNATDWAYTATWAPNNIDHPVYTPVHRYARNIIVSLNHWMNGWIDWNVVLDRHGGPNHVGNFCGAPIMIDTDTGQIYYTPIYYVLAQFSRTIRPGDKGVQAYRFLDGLGDDDLHASASMNDDGLLAVQVLNTTKEPVRYALQVGDRFAEVEVGANAVQTVMLKINRHTAVSKD